MHGTMARRVGGRSPKPARARSRSILGVALAAGAVVAGCTGIDTGSDRTISSADSGPLAAEARSVADAISGHVVVAAFTNPLDGEGVAEIVYYRPDGTGIVDRLAAREPTLQTFRWSVRARPSTNGASYVFISGDDRDDGAAVTYSPERQRLTFSDVRYGPYFSFGLIQNCWPGFLPTRPPSQVPVCNASADSVTLRRLESEQAAVANLRAAAVPDEKTGPFTTQPGAVYTNSLGNTVTVRRVEGHVVSFTNQAGAQFVSHALLYSRNPRVQGNETVYAAIDRLWPLAIGKTAEAWVYNADWAWHLQWKVTRHQAITVPAGTFDAWAIEHTETSMQDGYIGKSESWYAPSVGWNVRYRNWVETPSSTPPSGWVLTSAELPRS